jgi:hypothetical protein
MKRKGESLVLLTVVVNRDRMKAHSATKASNRRDETGYEERFPDRVPTMS